MWSGPIQEVFDSPRVQHYVHHFASMLIFSGPISPPKSNPPFAFAQHKVLQPGDSGKIVAERVDCIKHIADAQSRTYPHLKQEDMESPELVAAVEFVCRFAENPAGLVSHRKRVLADMRTAASDPDIRLCNARLHAMMPATVAKLAKRIPIDICLFYIINTAIGSPDVYLPHAFVTGFPMKGYLHRAGWFRRGYMRERREFEQSPHEWNVSLIRSIRRRALKFKEDGLAECYEATVQEVKAGWMEGPFSYDRVRAELAGHDICALRRFPQYRYPGAPVRPCDNGAENGTNDDYSSEDKLTTENSDFPLRVAQMYWSKLAKPSSFRLATNDLKKAYRQCPSGHPGATVVALWNPAAKRVEFFIVLGMPFGLGTSVLQFNRPMEAMQSVMRRMLGIPCAHYYDDWATPSPGYAAKSDDDSLREFHRILGFLLDDDKWAKPAPGNPFLGVQYDFCQFKQGVVSIRIKPDRKRKIRAMISHALTSKCLSSGDASSLRGKLYFACTQAFGRVGRAALQPLVARQRSQHTHIDGALEQALLFFDNLLEHIDLIPRVVHLSTASRQRMSLS